LTDERIVQWFGESWEAPVCDPEQEIAVPVDRPCVRCGIYLLVDDQGLAIPYVDPLARELVRPGDELPDVAWEHLYFHRGCFMEAIRD